MLHSPMLELQPRHARFMHRWRLESNSSLCAHWQAFYQLSPIMWKFKEIYQFYHARENTVILVADFTKCFVIGTLIKRTTSFF